MSEIREENNEKRDLKKKEEKNVLSYYIKLVVIFSVLALTFWLGFEKGKKENPSKFFSSDNLIKTEDLGSQEKLDLSLYWNVLDKLKSKYVDADKLKSDELLYNSIKGMVATTGDPYTVFMDPKENKEFGEDIGGTFEGIGAELGMKQGILTVVSPLKDSPAEKAGLRAGDKILKVNDESTENMSVDVAVSKIRGKDGTTVKLTIYRDDSEEKTKDIEITRGVIKVDSVTFEMKGGTAYFNVVRFGDDTAIVFSKLMKQMPKDTKGVIIDLRSNPGGYLDVAIDLASLMLPNGKTVVIEEGRDGKKKTFNSRGKDEFDGKNIVVLINEGSASASEILAGALRDNKNDTVTLVGKKSYGKGSVQELVNLPGDTSVKITVARWLTPSGEQINEKGIDPEVEVELTEDDYNNDRDPQLDKALEIATQK